MGEIADMMLDGTLCECCGVLLDGKSAGYPRYCGPLCAQDRGGVYDGGNEVHRCDDCGRQFKTAEAAAQHWLAKHAKGGE